MISIPAQLIDGILVPVTTLPPNRIYTVCNGTEFLCYLPGDEIPQTPVGNTSDNVCPAAISPRQARLVLARYGLLEAVNTAVAAMGATAQIEWEYATEVRRDNPLLGVVAAAAGLTPEQVDSMFTEAMTL